MRILLWTIERTAHRRAQLDNFRAVAAELAVHREAEAALVRLSEAHQEHLRTGDYVRLGMAAQDIVRGVGPPLWQLEERAEKAQAHVHELRAAQERQRDRAEKAEDWYAASQESLRLALERAEKAEAELAVYRERHVEERQTWTDRAEARYQHRTPPRCDGFCPDGVYCPEHGDHVPDCPGPECEHETCYIETKTPPPEFREGGACCAVDPNRAVHDHPKTPPRWPCKRGSMFPLPSMCSHPECQADLNKLNEWPCRRVTQRYDLPAPMCSHPTCAPGPEEQPDA